MKDAGLTEARLLSLYDRVAEAEDAIPRLRRFVLDLAVRGKLVPQEAGDEPASVLLERIDEEKARLVKAGVIRRPRDLDDASDRRKPFGIPKSWAWVRLDRIGAIVGGGTPSAADHSNFAEPGEGFPWLTPADLGGNRSQKISRGARDLTEAGLKASSATLMPAGTVLFTSRAPIGYVAIAANTISTNQGFKSIVPYVAGCSEFIATAMRAFAPEIDAAAPGTTFKEVSGKIVAGLPFPLPPLAEQHRIVAKVEELMALLDRLEVARAAREETRARLTAATLSRLTEADTDAPTAARFALQTLPALTTRPDQIKTLRQTILNLAVRGKLVEQDAGDEPASLLLDRIQGLPWKRKRKMSELQPADDALAVAFALPSGWTWCSVDALVSPDETVTYGILKPEWVPQGIPTVRVTEMKTGIIDVLALPHCNPVRAAKFNKTTLRSGDLLISKDGTIGKTAFVPPELEGGNITQHMLRFPICDLVDRSFIRLCIDAPFCQAWMAGETKGVALQGVNVGDFRRMPLPLPPLAEQHRIVAKVEEFMSLCDRIETALREAATTGARLLDATLREALAGPPRDAAA